MLRSYLPFAGWQRTLRLLTLEFFDKYKLIVIPTNAAWTVTVVGSGAFAQVVAYLYVDTGTTPNSSAKLHHWTFGLNSGDRLMHACDYSKRLEWEFVIVRRNSDPEATARIQLKQTIAEGALADQGIGLEISNFDVFGEAYGTARDTVSLGTLTEDRLWRVRIVHIPGARVEFWVNGVLKGTLTGAAVPTGVTTTTSMVISIINGPTGGVAARFYVSKIVLTQEW